MQNSRLEGLVKTAFHNANESINQSAKNICEIANVNSSLDTAKEGISELEDLSYSQELRITCLELGMDISELESM